MTLPAGFDREIPQTRVFLGGDIEPSFALLAEHSHRPMGIELRPSQASTPSATRRPAPEPLILGPGPFSDALFVLLEHSPAYTLLLDRDVPDIVPIDITGRANHFLDVPLEHFEVKDVSITQALYALRHALNPAFPEANPTRVYGYIGGARTPAQMQAGQDLFDRHVTLAIDRATPRQILNRLVAIHGALFWTADYRGRLATDPASSVESDCTLSLRTFDDIGIATSLSPRR